jgi:hypothetical protein
MPEWPFRDAIYRHDQMYRYQGSKSVTATFSGSCFVVCATSSRFSSVFGCPASFLRIPCMRQPPLLPLMVFPCVSLQIRSDVYISADLLSELPLPNTSMTRKRGFSGSSRIPVAQLTLRSIIAKQPLSNLPWTRSCTSVVPEIKECRMAVLLRRFDGFNDRFVSVTDNG